MEEILKAMPNGGAVIAIIFVAGMFLKEIRESRQDYLNHLRELTGQPPLKPRK